MQIGLNTVDSIGYLSPLKPHNRVRIKDSIQVKESKYLGIEVDQSLGCNPHKQKQSHHCFRQMHEVVYGKNGILNYNMTVYGKKCNLNYNMPVVIHKQLNS